jgi:LacI family transcriptional regulator, galactose operon repressor
MLGCFRENKLKVSSVGQNTKSAPKGGSQRHTTILDVARAANVSPTTVSLAFQPDSRISHRTRERVLAIADKLLYIPNTNAQTLRLGRSKAIGFVVNDITNPFYASMVQTAEVIAQTRGYDVVFADNHWSAAGEIRAVESMIQSRVQGVLLCSSEKTKKSFALLDRYSMPHIVVDTAPEWYQGSLVGNNLVAAGEIAAKHLMDVSCRHPGLLTASQQRSSFSAFQSIQKGFLNTLAQYGINLADVPIVSAGLTIDQGRFGFASLLKRASNLDGVLCVNDLSAIGAIETADAKGIQVGRDLAVIGIDDLEISRTSRISLTSIRQPYHRIVEFAVNAIIDGIESSEVLETRVFVDPELIVRDSTRRRLYRGAHSRFQKG